MVSVNLGPHTITVVNPTTGTGDYGTSQVLVYDPDTGFDVTGCSVQPATAAEFTIDRDSVTTRWVAYIPWGTDITALSRVTWYGTTYQVDGDIERWDDTLLPHLKALLRRSKDD